MDPEELLLQERIRRLCRNTFGYDACELSVLEFVKSYGRAQRLLGNQEMLDSIRATLEGYPHSGGDIRVMGEVERIKKEAIRENEKLHNPTP